MNFDERAALEEELAFLLRSLDDLDLEKSASDMDADDYTALRSSYVARAAEVRRELDGSSAPVTAKPRSWRRILAVCAVVIAVGSVAGWLVARESGQRLPGDSLSGDTGSSTASMLSQASQLGFSNPDAAIELYTGVLAIDPDNVEALTYRGWITALSARDMTGNEGVATLLRAFADLKRAVTTDPSYPDAYCFLGIVQFRYLSDAEGAKSSLDSCVAANPPAQVMGFVNSIIEEVDAALAAG